jgi:hypothetical protein
MHCQLIVPALFARPPGARLPSLELLLARARGTSGEMSTTEQALYDAFEVADDNIAAGVLTRIASGKDGQGWWMRADPVHLRLMRDRLIVVPAEAFDIQPEEAAALSDALNRHFAGSLSIEAVHPRQWCARLDGELAVEAARALDAAGGEADLKRPVEKRAYSIINEAQMLLHAHALNEAREARGEPTINSVWLWGAGRAPEVARCPWRTLAADDPVALGLARLGGAQPRALPESADLWLDSLPEDGRHLAVIDELRVPHALGQEAEYREALESLERRWFAPLLAALRGGRAGMVTLHVPDSADGGSFEAIRGDLRRFWRVRRGLEHYA